MYTYVSMYAGMMIYSYCYMHAYMSLLLLLFFIIDIYLYYECFNYFMMVWLFV